MASILEPPAASEALCALFTWVGTATCLAEQTRDISGGSGCVCPNSEASTHQEATCSQRGSKKPHTRGEAPPCPGTGGAGGGWDWTEGEDGSVGHPVWDAGLSSFPVRAVVRVCVYPAHGEALSLVQRRPPSESRHTGRYSPQESSGPNLVSI